MIEDLADNTPGGLPVSALVGDEVQRVAAESTLREVCAALADRGVGIVGVGQSDTPLTGVLSERDIIKALAAGMDPDSATADEVKATHVFYVDPTTTVDEVAAEMLSRWTRHLFVGEPTDLLGVVSARDILGAYSSAAGTD